MEIRLAEKEDFETVSAFDRWISREELKAVIGRGRILIAEQDGVFAGWLRYGLFWDEIPFMNLLRFKDEYRRKGFGRVLVRHWEELMREYGFRTVMTSTSSAEDAQHFYRKLGYREIGGFLPLNEPYELIFMKELCK